MRELQYDLLEKVAGAAYITGDYTECVVPTVNIRETLSITVQLDGSMPPELQSMIDGGASWEQMAPWLTLYSIMLNDIAILQAAILQASAA